MIFHGQIVTRSDRQKKSEEKKINYFFILRLGDPSV
jgi:hypothetical protein